MNLSSGATVVQSVDNSMTLAEAIKQMQKRSTNFKEAWAQFCVSQGGGRYDPSKHDPMFCANFFDQVAAQACLALGQGPTGENPLKRMRDSSGMGLSTGGGGGPMKDSLVMRVKNLQRMGPELKDLWNTYADSYLQGVRDPSRHDAATLQEFCTNHDIPEANGNGGGGGAAMRGSGGCGGAVSMGASDPMKADLVQRVKAFQKSCPEGKEAWNQCCGSTKDPARHDTAKLEEFCMMYSI